MESVWDKAKETVEYQTYFIIWILLNSVMWPDHMYSGAELSVTDNSQSYVSLYCNNIQISESSFYPKWSYYNNL